ncbi:chemotaxis protein CheX [Desulfospira joergensenii]|uniref:chemotaxis protein CheX n=1 Tax=Desulfospira joergensenii TaxID=53329 RepID=UPI0003B39513|nr:chemotaxis protein CheX [Desulfospira joergensenii]
MDVKYINPFISASMEVFLTFAGVESHPGAPVVSKKPLADKEINGFIGLNGHGISGYFIINFSSSFLTAIYAEIFDHSKAKKEELYDLAGELTNMITGMAKAELSKQGFFFDVAVPKISQAPLLMIPQDLVTNPVIVVPFDTRAGKFYIEASIQTIDEDFQQDSMPEVTPPDGYISVDEFAQITRMVPVKVRRLLKTGFIQGKKISAKQWHIPWEEIDKIQGNRISRPKPAKEIPKSLLDETVSVQEFAGQTGLSPTKVKSFLRSGFLAGVLNGKEWRVKKGQISKFNKKG